MYINEEVQNKYLPELFFPLVAMIKRNTRYVNKRIIDPQIKIFLDENNITVPVNWGLPVPNEEAAYKSLGKYGKSILPMSEQQVVNMNLAWEMTFTHFYPYMGESSVLEYADAKTRLDMTTTTGAPFNMLYKTKAELFTDPSIDEWLEKDWDTLSSDPNWTCLFTNSLKEEVRPQEKIDLNSLRTFLSSSVDGTIHGTRLFVDMNEKMYASHLLTSSAVAMTPLKGKWDQLYRKLNVFPNGYALDETQYDSSLRSYMMWGCALLRWRMYAAQYRTLDNLQRLRTYYRNLINTLVICPDGVIVMKKTGNPSGSVNTITDNTLILYTLLAYAWVTLAPAEMHSVSYFEEHTAKALVGDDNTWSVSDEAHVFFNAVSVISVWREIGITTTTDSYHARPVKELDFLSAHTVFMNGFAVPVYDREKILCSLLFAPKEKLSPIVTLQRATAMLQVGWTDPFFRRFVRELIHWLLKEYDSTLYDEPEWILAKTNILDDVQLKRLFLGDTVILRPQSLSGRTVKLAQPDKSRMSTVIKTKNVRRKKKAKRMTTPVKVVVTRPPPKRKNRRKQRNANGNLRSLTDNQRFPRTGLRTRRTCTVTEDEFIAPINGSVGFVNTVYAINPGNSRTFPWLSAQAKQWEKYHFNSLEFYYKPVVSQYATNGQTGKIIYNVNFDANDAPPVSKIQIEDSDPRVDCMPSQSLRLPLSSKNIHSLFPVLFVRPGGVPGSSDIKTFDAGNLNVATVGNVNTTEIGELRVRYSVTFSVPVLENATGPYTNYNAAVFSNTAGQVLVSGTNANATFPTTILNGNGIIVNPGYFTLPVGRYVFEAAVTFAASGGAVIGSLACLFQKNGVNVGLAYTDTVDKPADSSITSMLPSFIVESNGTDNFSILLGCTYVGGVVTTTQLFTMVTI